MPGDRPPYDSTTLKACLAAVCDDCRALYIDGDEDLAAFRIEREWGHGNGDDGGECEAGAIRDEVDPDGVLTGVVVTDAVCAGCGYHYRAADGHRCEGDEPDWIFVRDGKFCCDRCGAHEEPHLTAELDIFLAHGRAFMATHADCEEPEADPKEEPPHAP